MSKQRRENQSMQPSTDPIISHQTNVSAIRDICEWILLTILISVPVFIIIIMLVQNHAEKVNL